jgi:tetratricopeptide (TPR) repeat protein
MRVVPNWRFLIPLTVVLTTVGVAVHLTHRWQVPRQSGVFLREADAAHERKDADREIAYLQRYLRARPDDLDARERLGRRRCESSASPKQLLEGYLTLQDVLRQDGGRDELRLHAAALAMRPQLEMYAEAEADLKLLLDKRPGDADLMNRLGDCLVKLDKNADAVKMFRLAAEHRPDLVTAYGSWAVVLRQRLKDSDAADAVIARMVNTGDNRNLFRTHTILAEYWRMYFRPEQLAASAAKPVHAAQGLPAGATVTDAAAEAIASAARIAPDELDVILLAADTARDRGVTSARSRRDEESRKAFDEARRLLTRGAERHPQSASVYRALAAVESAAGRPADAVAAVQKGLGAIPGSVELTLALLDYQIRAADAAGAASTLDRLKSAGLPPAVGEYHAARLLMLRERYFEAARALDRVRQDLAHDPAMTREANLLLGRCYQQFGESDRALAAFRRAVPTDPTDPLWVPAVSGVAEAEAALGQVDAALASYRKLKDRASGAWLPVARLEMISALQTPDGPRDWGRTSEAVASAKQVLPDSPEVAVLEADLFHFKGQKEKAREALDAARTAHPKATSVWLATAAQHERDGELKQAAETLTAAEKAAGDSPELRLAKARLWVAAKGPDLATRLTGLGAGGEAFGRERHHRLLKGLAELAAAAGVWEAAGGLWDQVVTVAPDDLTAQLVRFDRAVAAEDEAGMDRVRAEVERIDGEAGASTRLVKAIRLVWKAQHRGDASGLREAAALLDGLARERAGWGRVTLARAVVHDLQKEFPAAAAKYQQAIEGGEANPQAVRRLMELLASGGRDVEAEAVFRKLADTSTASAEVQRMAAEVSLRTNNLEVALKRAALAVSDSSTNPNDHIWVGRVFMTAREREKAEAPFRRAVALRPDSADVRLTLVQYLVNVGRKDEAVKEFDAAKEKVTAGDRALFVARAQAMLGNADAAAEAFRAASKTNPTDPRTVRAEAEFLFNAGRWSDARDAFHGVLKLGGLEAEETEQARRMLAMCYAADGDPESSRRGLEVLGLAENGIVRPLTGTETPAQQRTRAVALALQPDPASKKEAARALEAIRDKLTPADLFLLAQLYVKTGDRPRVRLALSDLVRVAGREPVYVAYYAKWLLREKDLRAADEWVGKFAELEPDSLLSAELKARLLAARNQLDRARDVLRPKTEGPKGAVGPVAQICEEIGLLEEADSLYRRLWDENKTARPETGLVVAAYYGRRGRTDEALALCDTVRKSVRGAVVGDVAVYILYAAQTPSKEAMKTVAGWLEEAAKTAGGQARTALVRQLATLRNLQGDYEGAMDLYRRVLAANEKDALALNNLAFLMSAHKKHDDALALLDRARRVIGHHPALDDTEAMVRLNRGEPDAARKLLEGVVAQTPTGTAYFHLALTEQAAKRQLEAQAAWKRATEAGLRRADLHPLERETYDRMASRRW